MSEEGGGEPAGEVAPGGADEMSRVLDEEEGESEDEGVGEARARGGGSDASVAGKKKLKYIPVDEADAAQINTYVTEGGG